MNTNPNFLQEPVNNTAGPTAINKPNEIAANLQAALPTTHISSIDNIISDVSQPLDFMDNDLDNRRWPEL